MAEEDLGMVSFQVITSALWVSITDRLVGCVDRGRHKINPKVTDRGACGRCGGGGLAHGGGRWALNGVGFLDLRMVSFVF